MSSVKRTFEFTQGLGYRIYHKVFDSQTCLTIFGQFTLELCFFVFRDYARNLVHQYGLETTSLISDRKKRLELGISDQTIRRNGNPRESKVLKKSGKTTLYASHYIRDGVKRNVDLKNILTEMYGTDKLAYTQGLEYVIYKPRGTGDSSPVLDCRLMEPLNVSTSVKNPFHYTGFVCLADGSLPSNPIASMDTGSESDSTEESSDTNDVKPVPTLRILENFDFHYENIRGLMGESGPCPLGKQKKHLDMTLLDNLNIDALNSHLKKIHDLSSSKQQLFRPLRWNDIFLKQGDFIVFDCRLPYSTGKVKGSSVMLVPISLRPVSAEWYSSIQHFRLVEGITKGKIGDWSKRSTKGCNSDEIAWRNTETVLVDSRINRCIDISSFNKEDRLIFGLDRYIL